MRLSPDVSTFDIEKIRENLAVTFKKQIASLEGGAADNWVVRRIQVNVLDETFCKSIYVSPAFVRYQWGRIKIGRHFRIFRARIAKTV